MAINASVALEPFDRGLDESDRIDRDARWHPQSEALTLEHGVKWPKTPDDR